MIFRTESKIEGATLNIRAFYINDKGYSNEDAFNEDVIVSVKKRNHKNKVDISNFKLKIPKAGIFIGLEWMIVESNKYKFEREDLIKGFQNDHRFEPCLSLNTTDKDNTFRYQYGKWHKRTLDDNPKFQFTYKKNIEPAINLTLTN